MPPAANAIDFAVTLSNIRNNMAMAPTRVAMNQVLALQGWNMAQEVEWDHQKTAWRELAEHHGKTPLCIGSENVQAASRDFNVESHRVIPMGGQLDHVEPNRTISEVLADKQGMGFAFLDTHTVSKPYRGPAQDHRQFRNEHWRQQLALFSQSLHATDQSRCIVFGGDLNNPVDAIKRVHGGPLLAGAKLVVSGYDDHVWVKPPAGWIVRVVGSHSVITPSDHRALHVSLRLARITR